MESTLTGLRGINLNECDTCTDAFRQSRFVSQFTFVGAMLCTPFAILLCKTVIGIVSGYDVFLTIKYVESLPMMELNPIGRWLMGLDRDYSSGFTNGTVQQTAWFITAKFFGNLIAFGVIEALAHWRRPLAATVAMTLALVQLCLLSYLLFASN